MPILAKLIGASITAFGLAIFASPQFTQKVFAFFKQGKRIYLSGVIRIAAGLVLVFAAGQSSVPLAAIALGALFVLSGVIIFAADPDKLKSFLEHYGAMPGLVLRLFGLVAACFGVLVFSIF